MKIGILGIKGLPGRHGVEVVVDNLAPRLVRLGHEVTVYGYDSYTNAVDDYHGVRLRAVGGSRRASLEMITHMWNASLASRREDFDVVHIHSTDPCLLAWLPRTRFGVVATSHGQAYLRRKWGPVPRALSHLAERSFMRLPDLRTSVSRSLAEFYRAKYRRPVHYIPNGVERRRSPGPGPLARWGLAPRGYVFCSAGRFERTKGLHTLLAAHRASGVPLPLVIAGGGRGSDEVYAAEIRASAGPSVIFSGFLTGEDLDCLYVHAALFVFPSEYEAMSMALLEAMSCGVPTIYSDTPENADVARGIAYPFRTGDAASLAGRIREVLDDYDRALAMGRRAAETILRRHDWMEIARSYEGLYRALAGEAPATAPGGLWTEAL